ncbi:MAG: xylulokinase [Akkermansiaceae bacterium]
MFLGIDSSTQSLSALLIDATNGQVLAEESVNFGEEFSQYQSPSGFIPDGENGEVHSNPLMWLDALDLLMQRLSEATDLSKITHIAGSGQQHGSVYLNDSFDVTVGGLRVSESLSAQLKSCLTRHTSPIWMDTSTGTECAEIASAVGGDSVVCSKSGSIAIERFTGPQIRKFFKADPHSYQKTERIHLVSSFIASVFAGKSIPIDFGDGAGMNLLNLHDLEWDQDLLEATAPELHKKLLPPRPCLKPAGLINPYFVEKYGFSIRCEVCPFTGDNPASLVGMGATAPGQIVVSLGTSDTFFAAMPEAKTDPKGYGHVFGNPAGGFMSLICFRNGSLARETLRDELAVDWAEFDVEALAVTEESAGKNLTLPFYGAEITPRYDFGKPVTKFSEKPSPSLKIRSLLEGQFLNMRLHSAWIGISAERILLTGGASKNNGIAQMVADIFQVPVERLEIANSAALGAALIAATAAGNDLPELQSAFCKTSKSSRLEPDPTKADRYETALAEFEGLVQESMS